MFTPLNKYVVFLSLILYNCLLCYPILFIKNLFVFENVIKIELIKLKNIRFSPLLITSLPKELSYNSLDIYYIYFTNQYRLCKICN